MSFKIHGLIQAGERGDNQRGNGDGAALQVGSADNKKNLPKK
jgi:hypothetical protein